VKILLDSKSIQVAAHRGTLLGGSVKDRRLRTFLGLLEELATPDQPAFSEGPLCAEQLRRYRVLIIATRRPAEQFTKEELTDIPRFVKDGGGLWLLSNHGDYVRGLPDMRKQDSRLAGKFGMELERTCFETDCVYTRISGSSLYDHPIIAGQEGEPRISSLVTNNSCSISCGAGKPIAFLPHEMSDRGDQQLQPADRMWAHALDGDSFGEDFHGRVVTTADSGFIGDADTTCPGPGLIDRGDNATFVTRVVRWLGAGHGQGEKGNILGAQ
jgi:hypothetical protein